MTWPALAPMLAALALVACAPLPAGVMGSSLAQRWQPSPNFNERRPSYVVLHQTSNDTVTAALRSLTDPEKSVSAHYLLGRDGSVLQLVDERMRAWHAGESYWGGLSDLNSSSIGIELDNNGDEPFSSVQIAVLLELLADIKQRHKIPAANFIGHGDIAPRRKVDPSRYFPWQQLATQGIGIWCDSPAAVPLVFDPQLALQTLGYDVSDTAAATRAFQRHFSGDRPDVSITEDESKELSPADKAMLHCLVRIKASGK